MPLWDDATNQFTQQGPVQQNDPSLWGWLTSLFSPRPPSGVQGTWDPQRSGVPQTTDSLTSPGAALVQGTWNPQQARAAATPPLQPEVSWNANPWANMSAVPASMQVAPPSMFTAANPQQQAQWQRASNPAGYMGMGLPQVPQAAPPVATPSVLRPPAAAMMPPPPKPMPPPVLPGPGNIPAPAGGSTGWGGYGTMGILPPGYGPINPPPSPVAAAPPPSQTAAAAIPLTDTKSRNLSDAELEKMGYGDIMRIAVRPDLTYADRMALLERLKKM